MAEQKPTVGGRLIATVGLDRDDHCTVCDAHFSDPHAPDCPANDAGEACVWLSRAVIRFLIANLAEASDATAHQGAQWGDPDADTDVVTTTTAHGLVTVPYDNVAEAVAHGGQLVTVYAYPTSRPRAADEDLAAYAQVVMCDEQGANRAPVEIVRPSLFQAIAAAVDGLTPKESDTDIWGCTGEYRVEALKAEVEAILGDDFTVAVNPHSDFPSVEIGTFSGSGLDYVGRDPETGKFYATQEVEDGPYGWYREDAEFATLAEAVGYAREGVMRTR
jgi:hypothetical protein